MISEQGIRGIRPLDLWAWSRDVTTIDLPATFIYRLRQVMSSSISPGLLDGNPPPRRGAPGEDLVDPAGGPQARARMASLGRGQRLNREDSNDHDRDETVGCPCGLPPARRSPARVQRALLQLSW